MIKRFSRHLNNISILSCETRNAHRTRAIIELLQKETPEQSYIYITLFA